MDQKYYEVIVGQALRDAYDWMSDHGGKPEVHRVVLNVLATVADIERRMAKRKRADDSFGLPVLARPSWHGQVVHTIAELREATMQRRRDNMEDDDTVTVEEVVLASAVNGAFFAALPSRRTCELDWKVIKKIASSGGTEREI